MLVIVLVVSLYLEDALTELVHRVDSRVSVRLYALKFLVCDAFTH